MFKWIITLFAANGLWSSINQTDEVSPIYPPDSLPYKVSIELADFQLPTDSTRAVGLQSFAWAIYKNKWILLAGRTNGLHGFDAGDDNFPPKKQNTDVFVVDLDKKTVVTRSLLDPSSGLSVTQIDSLSTTSGLFFQIDRTFYFVGGYGVETQTGQFSTKSTLTAVDMPGLISWVEGGSPSAIKHIRQISHPLMQVTGGFLTQASPHQPYLIILGQNFQGYYHTTSNGDYTQQIRPFQIIDNGRDLYVRPLAQFAPDANYRRRDLPVFPIIQKKGKSLEPGFVALSGVFTTEGGIWNVPIVINADGSSSMANPANPNTFKQGMNNYDCARIGLYSKKTNDMFLLLFGGLSFLEVSGGVIVENPEIPFINSVTTVKISPIQEIPFYLALKPALFRYLTCPISPTAYFLSMSLDHRPFYWGT
jgi:hypothetical protein